MRDKIKTFNEWLAIKLGSAFSTMACFYLFNFIAFLPVIWPQSLAIAQYISSGYLQLVSLPLLGVAAVILGRAAEERAEQDHQAIMFEVSELKLMQDEIKELLDLVHSKMG